MTPDAPTTGAPTPGAPTTGTPTHNTPYGTPDTPRVAVRGEAHLEVDPEIATIGITISAHGTDRHTTLDDLTRRNTEILNLIKTYGDTVEKLETGAFSISPELTRHGRGERIRAYHGHVHLTAELTDFTTLGELTTHLADLDLTRIDGPWWALRPDSPSHGRARRQAVLDAVQRAREYAEALGARITALVELADLGAENTGRYDTTPPSGMRTAAYSRTEGDTTPPLDLEPQRQTVHAQVDARFTMTPPDLNT
jgi:uncharacterized protein YggE